MFLLPCTRSPVFLWLPVLVIDMMSSLLPGLQPVLGCGGAGPPYTDQSSDVLSAFGPSTKSHLGLYTKVVENQD